jgi:DivIVA domain-containing protein
MSPGDPRFRVLTADDVRATTFNRSQLGWRGYAEEEVEQFLAVVAESIAVADQERAALQAEIRRLRDFYRGNRDEVDRAGTADRHRHRTDGDDLVTAIADYADAQVDQAREYAQLVDSRDAGAARMLHHARIRAELAAQESLYTLGERVEGDPGLDRALVWLRAFADALRVQLDMTVEVLSRAEIRLAEWQAAAGGPVVQHRYRSAGAAPDPVGPPSP